MFRSSFSETQNINSELPIGKQDSRSGYCLRTSNPEVSCLLSAAIVNKRFAKTLLQDPALALEKGYQGRKFNISPSEREIIVAIRATTLQEFAAGLIGQFAIRATLDIGSF